MASWIKAAEDLFEVVDRRAKLVVSELADEQTDSKSQASNGKESEYSNRAKSKSKVRKPRSSTESSKTTESHDWRSPNTKDHTPLPADESSQSSDPHVQRLPSTTAQQTSDILPRKIKQNSQIRTDTGQDRSLLSAENTINSSDLQRQVIDTQDALIFDIVEDERGSDFDQIQAIPVIETSGEGFATTNGEVTQEKSSHIEEGPSIVVHHSSSGPAISDEGVHAVSGSNGVGIPAIVAGSNLDEISGNMINSKDDQAKAVDIKIESKMAEHEEGTGKSGRIQHQIDEAQGLLNSAVSVGQSKEARLARVCAGLSTRLQEYKSENKQLEELLMAERDLARSYEGSLRQMNHELSTCRSELTRVESNTSAALLAKNSEIESLVQSLDSSKKKAALSEGNLSSLQASTESIMRNRDLAEARMMQALREELASAERRAEEERAAHNSTKMAFMEREVDLDRRAVESSTALARVQRIADERTTKAIEAEQKMTLLEVEYSSLSQELQDMEARVRRDQKKTSEEGNQIVQMQVWQEVEKAHHGQRNAEGKLFTLEAEMQKLRIEMAAMKRDAEHYSRQEHMELEKRYRDLTDLLYYKQTQLEGMASEKAAAEFQLEKEMKRLRETHVEDERSRPHHRPSSSWEEDSDIKALEPLPLYHRHMATANIQLQKAAKLLDMGAVRATRFLWRYPTARILLLFYLVFVHLFLMYLLHRLQEQADDFATRQEVQQMRNS